MLPEARGKGLGAKLLQAGTAAIAGRGGIHMRSRIDVGNAPSVKLHLAAGFARSPGPSWLHRKVLD